MSPDETQPTVPRIPFAPEQTGDRVPADTGGCAADPSAAGADLVAPPSAADSTLVRTPADSARQESAQGRAAEGVPGYALLGELGRGGMGVVYKARHLKLNRLVALKMMLGAERASRSDLIRFLAEAEAVAAIRHENVVEVYD